MRVRSWLWWVTSQHHFAQQELDRKEAECNAYDHTYKCESAFKNIKTKIILGVFFEDEDCSSTWRAGTGLTPTYSSALRITDACWMKCSGCKWFLLAQYVITLSLTLKEETKNCFDKWFETLPSFTGFVLLSVCTSCFSCKAISSCPKTMLCRELQYNQL